MHQRCAVVVVLVAACSSSKSSSTCVPLAAVSDQCPPDWAAAMSAKDAFCAANEGPLFDAFLSTSTCHGRLNYTRHLFDAGPRTCVYDPTTLKLAGYGAFDGKALFQQYSCGVDRADFDDQGCAGAACPMSPADAGDGTTDGAAGDANTGGASDANTGGPASDANADGRAGDVSPADVLSSIDGAPASLDAPASDGGVEVRCDLVDQTCGEGNRCEFFCEDSRLVIGCDPIPADTAGLGEPCSSASDGAPPRLCGKGLGCFASAHDPARCYRYCRAGGPCPAGTTCDATSVLVYNCGTGGHVPAGICR